MYAKSSLFLTVPSGDLCPGIWYRERSSVIVGRKGANLPIE